MCVAVSFNKVQSNENLEKHDVSQNELDNIQKAELEAIDENAEDKRNTGPQTTRQPSPTSTYPCFCYNGGSAVCSNGRLRYCLCFNGYHGRLCQFAQTTSRSFPTTAKPSLTCYSCSLASSPRQCSIRTTRCFGSRSVCMYGSYTLKSSGRRYYIAGCSKSFNQCGSLCRNLRGKVTSCGIGCCQGDYCNRIHRFTTRLPPSRPQDTTTPRPLTCYRCKEASSPRECLIRTRRCYAGSSSVCAYGRYTLKSNGRSYYYASCASSLNACQTLCSNGIKRGTITACSMSCCQRDYCNRIVLSTTRRPITRSKTTPRTPNINSRFFLRLILKLLKSFKALIDVTSTLLKAHLKSNDAQFKKREIVSMMKRVDHTAQHLENSRDPEVIKVKRDVAETRMRAQKLIAKLDVYIDDEPDMNKK